MGVLVGLVVRDTVAVGTITVDVGLVVSVTVGDGVSEGSKVNVGGKGLGGINCVGSAAQDVQPVKIIDRMKSIVSPALFFIDCPDNLMIQVINTSVSSRPVSSLRSVSFISHMGLKELNRYHQITSLPTVSRDFTLF